MLYGPHQLKIQWLTQRCDSLDPLDIAFQEMSDLELSDENKRKLAANSGRRKRWATEKWLPFVADLRPGDEVWRFSSPSEAWAKKCGCAGYSVVRDGEIIRSLVTIRN